MMPSAPLSRRRRIRSALFTTLAAILPACGASVAGAQASPGPAARLITSAVSPTDRVAIRGTLRPAVHAARDLGAVDPATPAHHVTLVLQRSADRQAQLTQYLSDVQNPASPQFHHWLTPAEYGVRFGASPDDVQAVATWLQSGGFTVERTSAALNLITFSGNVGQLQAAFAVPIHSLSVGGVTHMANIAEAQVPRALAPVIKDVLGLDDIHPQSHLRSGPPASFNTATKRIEPQFTLFDNAGNPYLYVDPADAATIYDLPNANLNPNYHGTTYDGTGLTLGVVGDSNVDLQPVSNYRLAFLGETSSTVNLPNIIIDGEDPGINGDELEAWLDLQVLGGMAPKAKINYYASADSDLSAGLFNAIQRAVNDNTVSILSISYGECEAGAGTATTDFLAEIFEQAAAQGITVTVSTGDSGSAGCDADSSESAQSGLAVNSLASSPYDVAVGGTDYDVLATNFTTYVSDASSGTAPYYGTALSYIPERPWNDSTLVNGDLADNQAFTSSGATDIIADGGGISSVFSKPAFQSALTPADGARDLPDVSLLAGNGFYGAVWVLCENSAIYGLDCATTNGQFDQGARFDGAGGTSAATPAFAGMLALVEQATGSRLGAANNVLYQLASSKYSTVFHDITQGNNAVVCSPGSPDCGSNGFETGYNAGTGYDYASGLGSVDAAQMVANWNSVVRASSTAALTINGSTAAVTGTHGAGLNFGVTIAPNTATGSAGLVTTATAAAGQPTLNSQPVTIPITGGAGATTYNGLPGGQYTVYASYGGDTATAASQSNAISVNIASENSSTQLTLNVYNPLEASWSNLNAIPYGYYIFAEGSVYGTAEGYSASQGLATGKITVLDNGTSVGSAPITSGNFASFPSINAGVYPYAVGHHTVTATYPGDASYKANTSNAVGFTVVQGATTVSVTPTTGSVSSGATDAIVVEVSTSSLGLPPGGTITLTANGKTLGTSSVTGFTKLDGTVAATASFPVQGSQLNPGTNTLTGTYSGDSNYTGSNGTGTVTESSANFTLQAGSLTVAAGATTGNTATVTAQSSGGFAGVVNLACSLTSSPSGATSPVTCSVPATVDLTGTGPATATLTVNSTASTTPGAYVVTITGIDAATGKITASATSTVTVTGTPAITLAGGGTLTLTAGATSGNTATLTVTGVDSFAGAVALSCAVTSSPSGAVDPITCSVSPSSLTVSGSSAQTATLTIGSTARTGSSSAALGSVGGVVLAGTFGLLLPRRRRRQLLAVLSVALLASLGGLTGCGGGGSSNNGGGSTGQTGTTAGAYVVTVTATPAGAAVQTTTVNVTVN